MSFTLGATLAFLGQDGNGGDATLPDYLTYVYSFFFFLLSGNASLNLQRVVVMTNAVTVRSNDPWFTFLGFPPSLISMAMKICYDSIPWYEMAPVDQMIQQQSQQLFSKPLHEAMKLMKRSLRIWEAHQKLCQQGTRR